MFYRGQNSKSLKREIKIPRNPKIHEFEKLRLNFYSKEAVFNYLMKNLIDYDMIPEDKFFSVIDTVCKEIKKRNNRYFAFKIIKDLFADLEENMVDYLVLSEYKKHLEFPDKKQSQITDTLKSKSLKDLITDPDYYEKLKEGLVRINLIDDKFLPILENNRLKSDLAILFVKLNDTQIIKLSNVDDSVIVSIIENTFKVNLTSKFYNKIKNEKLVVNSLEDKLKSNQKFYKKLNFIDSINNQH